jgi:hypothetical protein
MSKSEFSSIVANRTQGDYNKADLIPLKIDDNIIKVCSKEEGQSFLIYLVKEYGEGIECIGTVHSYKEAQQLVDKLTDWISEDA